mmetsp:Transcript_10986/g.36086  ORF Transcript_10986/g.36086 Transcript_10986/m.36086 type:complete len:83 (-) Transcript_10986:20-268(-)
MPPHNMHPSQLIMMGIRWHAAERAVSDVLRRQGYFFDEDALGGQALAFQAKAATAATVATAASLFAPESWAKLFEPNPPHNK